MEGSEWLLGWSLSPCPSEFLCPLSLSLSQENPPASGLSLLGCAGPGTLREGSGLRRAQWRGEGIPEDFG